MHRAFTLPEMLVTLALVAILAAFAYPAVMQKITEGHATALAQTLDGINHAVQNYRGNVGRLPKLLSQLSQQPTTGAPDLCGNVVPDVNNNQWRGPYSSRTFPAVTGFRVGDATVKDTLRRSPANNQTTAYGNLFVDATGVDSAIVALIELTFDGTPRNYSAGTVQWARAAPPPAGPVGMLSFAIPVKGC